MFQGYQNRTKRDPSVNNYRNYIGNDNCPKL